MPITPRPGIDIFRALNGSFGRFVFRDIERTVGVGSVRLIREVLPTGDLMVHGGQKPGSCIKKSDLYKFFGTGSDQKLTHAMEYFEKGK